MRLKTKIYAGLILSIIAAIAIFAGLVVMTNSDGGSNSIGSVKSKGLLFKDKIEIKAFDDPTLEGVTIYFTKHVNGGVNIFDKGSSSTSISCRQIGPIKGELTSQTNVFKQSRGIIFKNNHIDRVYDSTRNVMIYMSYTKDIEGGNASHSISVVPIRPW